MSIALDGDEFIFDDPDASVSRSPEAGCGFLFFDSSALVGTAENVSELPVDANGKHARGDKRYQVPTLATF